MAHPQRAVAICLSGIMAIYKCSLNIARSSSFVLFLMEAGNLNFYVNSHNLHNLTSSLSKQTNTMCCGQNKIQLEEDEAHGLLVPTSDTDDTHAFPASWGSDSDIHS